MVLQKPTVSRKIWVHVYLRHSRLSVNRYPQATLDQHSINISINTQSDTRLTLSRQWSNSGSIQLTECLPTQSCINQHFMACLQTEIHESRLFKYIDQDIDQVSGEVAMGMLIKNWWRVLIDTWPRTSRISWDHHSLISSLVMFKSEKQFFFSKLYESLNFLWH